MQLKQYDIVLVNLDPSFGSEMKKTRPCVILSPDEMNRHLQTIMVAPMTGTSKPYPTRLEIKQPNAKGWLVLDQIRTIDRKRIVKVLDHLAPKNTQAAKDIIHEMLVR